MKYSKIVIWGYPLYSHTHSYVHYSYFKSFKSLGYDTYWFHDDDYPKDFDYTNTLFIGEGFADKNIPINDSSAYFIMYCPSPKKYESVEKYVDVRTVGINIKDHIYNYSLDTSKAKKVGPSCFFEPKTKSKIYLKNDYVDYEINDYDKLYISWATNLLPNEIDFDEMYRERENAIWFCGTISSHGQGENWSNWQPFIKECTENQLDFHYNDAWENPLSFKDVMDLTKKSMLGVDIRGNWHVNTKVVTCRVFKNISYGHLGLTNSKQIFEEMDGNCIYNPNPAELFHDGMSNIKNFNLIKKGMQFVKENHTYINRIQSILKVLGD